MKFKRIYKCARCDVIFTINEISDTVITDLAQKMFTNHTCGIDEDGSNMIGFAKQVGYDEVKEI